MSGLKPLKPNVEVDMVMWMTRTVYVHLMNTTTQPIQYALNYELVVGKR